MSSATFLQSHTDRSSTEKQNKTNTLHQAGMNQRKHAHTILGA